MNRKYIQDDTPIDSPEEDILGSAAAAQALADFIGGASTPLAVSVQGFWGSGKTSFMHLVRSFLDRKEGFKTIEIQSWDYFLSGEDSDGTEGVIATMLDALEEEVGVLNRLKQTRQTLQNFFAKGAGLYVSISGGDGDFLERSLGSGANKAKELRDVVNGMIAKNPSTTYVFFIDDLDRVSPLAAIEILDILKNVFFANRCIFVVAIDFDVVSKGLVEKYHLNEVEPHISRDYFDKIFQFSYQIPFNQGASTGLMWDGLKSIGYFGEGDDKGVIDEALQTSAALFDFNPRKIKRLISYMSYRKAFDAYNNHYLRSGTVYLRSTALVLAAIEVSMPDFIRHLCQYPHFSNPSIAALRDLSQDFEWAESSVGTKPNWQEAYRKALNGSPFKDQSLSILHALKTVQRFLQCDRHINFHTVLGLSNFVAASNGDVGIEDNEFSETVETSYLYGMRLLDMIEPSRGLSVLHLGCQDGAVSREILLRMPESYVRALEMQQSLAEAAKETLVSSGMDASRFDVEYRQIEDVNEHGKYDIVFSATAAHWIKQLAYVKAFDALKHGGRLYFEQSGKGTYEDMHKTLIEVVADIVPGKRGDIASIEPFYFPTAEELAAYLEKIGFTDVSVTEEIDSGERFDTLYEDYISTNARPYLEKMTEGEVSEIRDCFLNACHNENVGKSANILWITATKA